MPVVLLRCAIFKKIAERELTNLTPLVTQLLRLARVSLSDLLPWSRVEIVDTIPGGPTLRGIGGFGSTGVHDSNASATAAHVDVDLSGVPVVPAGGAGVTHS
jgi:hypothetical protein